MMKKHPKVVCTRVPNELQFLDKKLVVKIPPNGWLNETNKEELCCLWKGYADKFPWKNDRKTTNN